MNISKRKNWIRVTRWAKLLMDVWRKGWMSCVGEWIQAANPAINCMEKELACVKVCSSSFSFASLELDYEPSLFQPLRNPHRKILDQKYVKNIKKSGHRKVLKNLKNEKLIQTNIYCNLIGSFAKGFLLLFFLSQFFCLIWYFCNQLYILY